MSWSTTSWIFLAVAYASTKEPAKLDEVIGAADGINHAIPTHWELQRTLGRLQNRGLVIKESKRYSLTEAGRELMNEASSKHSRIFDVLEELSSELPDGGEIHKDEALTPEDVQAGYERYKIQFWKLYRESKARD